MAALVSLYYVSRPRDAIECVLELCNAIKRCALCGRPCGPVRTRVFAVHGRSFTHRFAAATRYVFTGPPLHRRCSQSESRWRRRWRPSLYRIVGFPLVPEGRGREGGGEGEREREREKEERRNEERGRRKEERRDGGRGEAESVRDREQQTTSKRECHRADLPLPTKTTCTIHTSIARSPFSSVQFVHSPIPFDHI